MPSLREEITKTFLRLTRSSKRRPEMSGEGRASVSSSDNVETVLQPGSHEGQQVGAYRILKRLGFGGMGHVYLALDTRLGRHVALKFLSPELTADEAMLQRLQQEARTASALNHPNILTIFEIGESNGEHFIASEFVDGATLRTAMERGVVDIPTALDVAGQVAAALVAAHAAGIVHRDLKPGNIMIRSDGYVKVIDFGLAKQIGPAAAALLGPHATRAGAVVGTVSYMSPEQARGEAVDHRTDIWSLGVILYEMIAHRRPFEGPTDSHVMVAIFDRPVPPLSVNRSVPSGLPRVIERALAKNKEKRYQTASELLSDLQQIGQSTRSGSKIRPPAAPVRAHRWKGPALLAIAAVLLLAGAIWWWPMGGEELVFGPDWFRIDSVRQITFNGRTNLACISPDGKYLAFVTGDPDGLETLYLKQVNSGSEEVKIPPKRVSYAGLTFSPDDQIFVVEKDQALMGRLFAIPIVGEAGHTPVLVDIDGPVSFSPDARRFAFVRYLHRQVSGRDQTESQILIANRDGSDVQKLISMTEPTILERIGWSPGGGRIAAILVSYIPGRSGESMLGVIDLKGRLRQTPLPKWRVIGQPWWTSDEKSLIIPAASRAEARNQGQLRQIAVRTGEVRDVTKDLAGYMSVSLTKDGRQLAAVKLESKAALWVSSRGNFSSGHSAAAEAEENPSLAWQDDRHLVVNSQRGGFPNLWLFDIDSQTRTSLTNEPFVETGASAVPHSKLLVFASNRTGQSKLWKFQPETNQLSQLTFGPSYDESPAISPDGRWVVYTSWTSTNPHLRRISIEGGESRPVGDFLAKSPQISPDGKWIACQLQQPVRVAVIPFEGVGAARIVPAARVPMRWAPDGEALSTVFTDRGVSNIWAVPLDGGAPRQLTAFDDQSILNFAWSPDGERLACVRASLGSDVALFSQKR